MDAEVESRGSFLARAFKARCKRKMFRKTKEGYRNASIDSGTV